MRAALAAAVTPVLAAGRVADMPDVAPPDLMDWLVELSTFAVRCRSAVERDPRSREIELVPPSEMPARLALVLWRLYRAMSAIGVTEPQVRRIIMKMALDSMPAARRRVLEMLYANGGGTQATSRIADSIGLPLTTTRRALEDLNAHAILEKDSGASRRGDSWWLSDWTRDRMAAISGTPRPREGSE
jgi:hypothetical protein